jgi:hypothetical protein
VSVRKQFMVIGSIHNLKEQSTLMCDAETEINTRPGMGAGRKSGTRRIETRDEQ